MGDACFSCVNKGTKKRQPGLDQLLPGQGAKGKNVDRKQDGLWGEAAAMS